jgi:hypothetical protein
VWNGDLVYFAVVFVAFQIEEGRLQPIRFGDGHSLGNSGSFLLRDRVYAIRIQICFGLFAVYVFVTVAEPWRKTGKA